MARNVLGRLELDEYASGLVIGLIESHLEMSAALRRDVADGETVEAFANKVDDFDAVIVDTPDFNHAAMMLTAVASRLGDRSGLVAFDQGVRAVVGPGHSKVSVRADVDLNKKQSTSETYTYPNNAPPLSSSTSSEKYSGTGAPVGGVLGPENMPDAATTSGSHGRLKGTAAWPPSCTSEPDRLC